MDAGQLAGMLWSLVSLSSAECVLLRQKSVILLHMTPALALDARNVYQRMPTRNICRRVSGFGPTVSIPGGRRAGEMRMVRTSR